MLRIIYWILSFCLLIGVGGALVRLTLEMAGAAVEAHRHQMSYSAFTKAMTGAKPRRPGQR